MKSQQAVSVNNLILRAARGEHRMPAYHDGKYSIGRHSIFPDNISRRWPLDLYDGTRDVLVADSQARGIDPNGYYEWISEIALALSHWPHALYPRERNWLILLSLTSPEQHWTLLDPLAITYNTRLKKEQHPLSVLMIGFNWSKCTPRGFSPGSPYHHFDGVLEGKTPPLAMSNENLGTGREIHNLKRAINHRYRPPRPRLPDWVSEFAWGQIGVKP